MIQHKDIFYSFTHQEINGFDEIHEAAKQLSTIPEDFQVNKLHESIGHDRFKQLRASLESEPDQVQALKIEAKAHLHKVLPKLDPTTQDQNHQSNKSWSPRPGHIAYNPAMNRTLQLNEFVNDFFHDRCECSGDFLYPPNGFRTWHTNKYDAESWTLFMIDVDASEKSFFRFIEPDTGKVITHWDTPGTVNIFKISQVNLLWHCIGTQDCHRWSQGFLLPEGWRDII